MVHAGSASAAIPLITDDTGTQGKGKFQLELFGEYGHDKEDIITSKNSSLSATLTYGLIDPVDIALTVPYQVWREDNSDSMEKGNGIGDVAIEAKWRFFDHKGFSCALKPGLTIPTGDESKGLGAGRTTYYLNFIASKEIDTKAFHINLAYIRNGNSIGERTDIWHASVAATVQVMKNLKVVGDFGGETNPERSEQTPPVYMLGGFIYSPGENIDIGLGVKGGLTGSETDISVRGGVTFRF
ncbi:MAG TPA: transporter [Thermodesulfovibrionales bacterium]|nr:transporter [Thermodesulfovibrionales bacterium]